MANQQAPVPGSNLLASLGSLPIPGYVVADEIALGIVYSEQPDDIWVLASGIGGPDWKNGSIPALGVAVRPATLVDFTRFRVTPPPNFKA